MAARSTQPAASDAGEAARTIEATTAAVEQATTATADMRVAEALGLRPTIAPTAAATVAAARTAPAARATTPLGRALAHAAWVDALPGRPVFVAYPSMGDLAAAKAFAIVILGGLGSIPGATAGGFILALVEELGASYISSGYRDAMGFLLIMLILVFKPTGLFAQKERIG